MERLTKVQGWRSAGLAVLWLAGWGSGCGASATAIDTGDRARATASTEAPATPSADDVFTQNKLAVGAANPAVASFETRGAAPVPAKELGFKGCLLGEGYVHDTAVPLASVEVPSSSKFSFKASGPGALYFVDESGTCRLNAQGNDKLDPGTYYIWAGVPKKAAAGSPAYQLSLEDKERDLAFDPSIPTHKVAADPPFQTLASVTRGRGFRPGRVCGEGDAEPVYFIDVDLPEWRKAYVLFGDSGVTLYGPLGGKGTVRGEGQDFEVSSMGGRVPCTTLQPTTPTTEVRSGRYAVFLDAKAPGRHVVLAIGDALKTDPLTPTGKLGDNPAVADRELGRYLGVIAYQYTARNEFIGNAHYLFENAPKQLFVYPKAAKQGLAANEPVLLLSHADEESTVLRANGETVKVRSEVLLAEPAGAVTLPQLAPPHAYDELVGSEHFDGWEEIALRRRATKRWKEFEHCVSAWRAKHDPTRKLGYDLINIRTGESLRDKKKKEARQHCKFDEALAVERDVLKEMTASQIKTAERAKKALQAKFR